MFVLISFVAENSIKVSEFYSPIQSEKNYLSMIDNNANKAISAGIENDNDDFALLNNGITMVCSNFTWTNENGLEGVSNVQIEDSQIINGGQMAGTL